MIQDDELRDLFRIESEEHLQKLDEGLLVLEKEPGNQEQLNEVFREAHSMKGAARMLGVGAVEDLAHLLEDRLGEAKRGDRALDSATIDRMYHALDAVRDLVREAVSEHTASVDVAEVRSVLLGRAPLPACRSNRASDDQPAPPETEPTPESEGSTPPASRFDAAMPAPEPSAGPIEVPRSGATAHKIETIRIKTDKLDALLNQAGELTVAVQGVHRRPADIESIIRVWEEWNRASVMQRRMLVELEVNQQKQGETRGADQEPLIALLRGHLLEERERLERMSVMLDRLKQESAEDAARLQLIAARLDDDIRDTRMLPLSTLFNLFPRAVRDMAREESKQLEFVIEGGETRADKRILEEMKDPIMHLLRNAVDHGIETPEERAAAGKDPVARLVLRGRQRGRNVEFEIEEDGRGMDPEKIKAAALSKKLITAEAAAAMSAAEAQQLIFRPGFSTRALITDVSGRGVGMDVVRTNVEQLKGSIDLESNTGSGTCFRIVLPAALSTTRVLMIQCAGQEFAIPTEHVEMTQLIKSQDIFTIEGRPTVAIGSELVSVARLAGLLDLTETAPELEPGITPEMVHSFVLCIGDRRLALIVDDLLDEQEIIFKSPGALLQHVPNVSGLTILESGVVCVVLNSHDLLQRGLERNQRPEVSNLDTGEERSLTQHTVLLAEDSITTRMQEKRILERAGYEVIVAVDGQEAYQKLTANSGKIDAIVSDVEMPNMDGFTLAEKVRSHEEFRELPILLVTTLSTEEHRRRGMQAGANAYITKGGFNQDILLDTLRRLI